MYSNIKWHTEWWKSCSMDSNLNEKHLKCETRALIGFGASASRVAAWGFHHSHLQAFLSLGVSLSFPRLSPQPGLSVCTAVALSLVFHVCNCTHLAGQAVFRFSLSLSKSTACLSVVVRGKYPSAPLFPWNSASLKIKSSLSENISRESTPSPLSHYINVNTWQFSLL